MAQRPKKKIRRAILDATVNVLSEMGFERATLERVAHRAGTSVGNVYRYFGSKRELYLAAVPPEFIQVFEAKLRGQVEALGDARDTATIAADHPYWRASEDLLRFSFENRPRIIFLLRHADGPAHGSFGDDVVQQLVASATSYATRAYPDLTMSTAQRRSLARIYRALVDNLATILEEETHEPAFREAVAWLTAYHLSGLRAFFLAGTYGSA